MGWFERTFNPNYRDSAEFQSDEEWFKAWGFEDCVEVDLALQHAIRSYEQATAIFHSLDQKADSLFRFSASIPAIVVAIAGTLPTSGLITYWIGVPVVLLLLAAASTLIARRTLGLARPMSVRNFMVLNEPAKARSSLAASYQGVTTGIAELAVWKSRWIDLSMWLTLAGMFSLTIVLTLPALL